MAAFDFKQMEALLAEHVHPEIVRHFEQSSELYDRISNRHTWLGPNGFQSYTKLMRGELGLPHAPATCGECRNAFELQLETVRGKFPGLGKHGGLSLSSRRNEIRRILRELAAGQGTGNDVHSE